MKKFLGVTLGLLKWVVPVEYVIEHPEPQVSPPEDEEDPGNKPNEPEGDDDKPKEDPVEGDKDISLSNRDDSLWANFIAREVPVVTDVQKQTKKVSL